MFKWIIKIISFFDRHPWDWMAHIVLGFLVFMLNFSMLRVIDLLIFPMMIGLIGWITIFGAINFVIAVELTQWDIFGISWDMVWDSIIDLVADLVGIGLAIFLMVILK